MKEDQDLEVYLHAVKGLGVWKLKSDLQDPVFESLRVREQEKTYRLMTITSVVAVIFSVSIFSVGIKKQEEVRQLQILEVARNYAVNNLNY
jgi:hypothetical protein